MNTTPLAQKYGWKSANEACSHSYLLPMAVGICRKHGTKRLLDIGTGNGHALHTWKQEGWEVSAMEPDAEGYEFAKQISGADVRRLGVGDPMPEEWFEAFDTVVSLEVVEHLFNPHQLVKTAAGVLRPGGIAVISTPYHGYLKNLLLSLANKWDFHHHPLRLGGHIKFWSQSTLQKLFEKGPFRLVEFHGAGRMPYLWKSMFMVFEKRP
jgi:2-polyprenyl-3-methyl-5-hydroxy-6-metoxy-1,4-benzoquinol methylase